MKRYIYILIGIVVIVAIVVLGLFIWKNAAAPAGTQNGTTGSLPSTGTQGNNGGTTNGGTTTSGAGTTGGTSNPNSNPGTVAGSFGPLSTDPVLNYFVRADNVVFAVEPNGIVAQIANGQTSYLSSSTIANVVSAGFSFDGKKALVNFGDPSNPQSSVFDVATKAWMPLPRGMQSPQWSPSDYHIAYLASASTGTEMLAMIDASSAGKKSVPITTIHANDFSLQWVAKNQFLLSSKPSFYAAGSALLFDGAKQTFTPIVSEAPGLESIWSATTSTAPLGLVFMSGASGQGGSLELDDLTGTTLQNLKISTLPSKCGFGMASSAATTAGTAATTASSTVVGTAASSTSYLAMYCGIPRDQATFSTALLPDIYNQMGLYTSDDIYRINMQTGTLDVIWNDSAQNVDVSDVKTAGSDVFFINRYNNELYTLTPQN